MFLSRYKIFMLLGMVVAAFSLFGVFVAYQVEQQKRSEIDRLLVVSKTLFAEHLRIRLWISDKGGVYVPKNPQNETNPYLVRLLGRVPEIETKDGKVFTLRNPALVLREMSEMKKLENGVDFRLVSSNPVNPMNSIQDDFERAGILALGKDRKADWYAIENRGGTSYFRFLAPFITQESCLACHASSGYKLGDMRGAMSISIPLEKFGVVNGKKWYYSAEFYVFGVFVFVIFGGLFAFIQYGQRALSRARDEALSATKAKSTFVSHLSHDLRTPLSGILGMVDILKAWGDLSGRQAECVTHIEASAEYMSSIVGNSLDIARIESGKIELLEIPFSLRDLLAKIVVAFPAGSREPGVELITAIDSGCPDLVVGDMTRILQILMNLVGNALKFTSSGYVKVAVHAEAMVCEKHVLKFVVADTGPGISSDMIQKIFDPFVRNGIQQKRGPSGTGLGLTIARELARLMGGDVTASSEVGQGTSFVVTVHVRAVR